VPILALETSCDETAASVVEGGTRVLSSVVASQHDLHAEYAGVVPEIASRAHVEALLPVVRESLALAGVGLGMIDAIAVGHRPGLIGSLLVGVSGAKALAWSLGKPLIGVDHIWAHIYSGALERASPVNLPALGLVVSGGHTSMYLLNSWVEPLRLGATIDDALGEAFDKAATILGLPHPGGPNLERLAREGSERAHDFPISRMGPGSLDFSFSGLKTSMLYSVRGVPGRETPGTFARDASSLTHAQRADLAASFQRAACEAVRLKLARALDAVRTNGFPVCTLLTGGGVTSNQRLRDTLTSFAEEHALDLVLPQARFCVDNAAMIAGLAHHMLSAGLVSDCSLQARPTTSC
jgi:N6-L-threonylcarbamoyladenine synthase